MDDQVERVVKGANRYDHANRLIGGEGSPPCSREGMPHRNFLPPHDLGKFLDGQADAIDGTGHFHSSIHQWFAALLGNEQGKVIGFGFNGYG